MSQDPFGDIPLFRELQKLLSAGQGPVNLEIARQVAGSMAAGAGSDHEPDRLLAQSYADGVRNAELWLGGYSRLSSDEPARSEVLNRRGWVTKTLEAWTWLFEELARRFGATIEAMSEGGAGTVGPAAVIGQVVPLLMGLQVGTLVGHLSQESLYRHDLPVPRDDDGKLFLIEPNMQAVARSYDFDERNFVAWIALRDVGHQLVVVSTPWLRSYHRSLLTDLVASIEIDLGDLERRLMELQTQGMEGLQQPQNTLPVVQTERYGRSLARLRAFVTVFEGYATHCARQVGGEVIEGAGRIEEGMTRHIASPSEGKTALAAILGMDLDRSAQTTGTTFCSAVVELRGIDALNHVWAAPDNLPSSEELRDPFQWMERVLDADEDPGDPGGAGGEPPPSPIA